MPLCWLGWRCDLDNLLERSVLASDSDGVRLALLAGADANMRCSLSWRATMYEILRRVRGAPTERRESVLNLGIIVAANDRGNPIRIQADETIVRQLVLFGADVNEPNLIDATPAQMAAFLCPNGVLASILAARPRTGTARDSLETFEYAASNPDPDPGQGEAAVRMLLAAGFDPSIRDTDGSLADKYYGHAYLSDDEAKRIRSLIRDAARSRLHTHAK
jgi:hypothetical protein